jgi:hypothetical protein
LIREVFKGIQNIEDRYTVISLDDFSNKEGFYLIRDNKTNQATYQTLPSDEPITTELLEKWFESAEK